MMRKVFLFLPVLLLMTIVIASQTTAQGVPAQIRVANYAPGSPVIEFWIDGAYSGIQTLKSGEISGWVQLAPGPHSFTFNAQDGSGVLVGPFGLTLAPGSFSTIAMGGGPDMGYFVTLAKENYVKPLDPVNARLTVVNSVAGLRSGLDLITADGTVLISNIMPGRSASVDLGVGEYDLRVVPTGTSGAGLNAYNLHLQPKTYYLMSAVRTDKGAGLAMTGMSEAPVEGLIASASQAGSQVETSVIASSGGGRQQRPRGDGLPPNLPAPPTLAVPTDVLSTIEADPRLTRLAAALKLVGMDQALSGAGPFTVFAPTDRAFAQVASDRVQTKGALRDLLTYHIVHDRIEIGQMFDQMTLLTTQGSFIRLTRDRNTYEINDTVKITSAQAPMVVASNGLIYILDQVLLPPSLAPTLAPSPTLALRFTPTPAPQATSTPQG
jgi:hypothetical protein